MTPGVFNVSFTVAIEGGTDDRVELRIEAQKFLTNPSESVLNSLALQASSRAYAAMMSP